MLWHRLIPRATSDHAQTLVDSTQNFRTRALDREAGFPAATGELVLGLQRGQRRLDGVAAAVALGATGDPGQGLLHGVDGEHAEADRDPGLQAHPRDAVRSRLAHVV